MIAGGLRAEPDRRLGCDGFQEFAYLVMTPADAARMLDDQQKYFGYFAAISALPKIRFR